MTPAMTPQRMSIIHDEMIRLCIPHGGVEPLIPILKRSRESIIARAIQLGVLRAPHLVQREALIRSMWGTDHLSVIANRAGISVSQLYRTAAALKLTRRAA